MICAILLVLVAYLVGSIPFGYLLGRLKGVDLFELGSGNIGATNVGRVLGRKYGILIFLIDFIKGAVPVALMVPLARWLDDEAVTAFGSPDALRVMAALAAFLGHLFPVYLGFRGGKGVATGAGAVFVLVPGPMAIAVLLWLTVVSSSRIISLSSIVAVLTLSVAHFLSTAYPFADAARIVTLFCLGGPLLVVLKHRTNVARLLRGTESRLDDSLMIQHTSKSLHVLALGLWFGSSVFFTWFASSLFPSFEEVVRTAPSDRTAYLPLAPEATDQQKQQLASALAGAAVGPMFPRFFALQAVCGIVALITAWGWRKSSESVHRKRPIVISLALLGVIAGWPISMKVSELRLLRFAADPAVAQAARDAFGQWHLVSLLLSLVTMIWVFIALLMAARLPEAKMEVQTLPS